MEEETPPILRGFLECIQKIMDIIQNSNKPIKITPELSEEVENFKTALREFKEAQDKISALYNLDANDLKSMREEALASLNVKSSDKQLIKQALNLENEACAIALGLSLAREQKSKSRHKEKKSTKEQNVNKRQIKERRKTFKSIGGDSKWIPL